jgi:hypothetical protein
MSDPAGQQPSVRLIIADENPNFFVCATVPYLGKRSE